MARVGTAARALRPDPLARLDPAWTAALTDAWRALWSSRLVIWACGALAVALWGIGPRADAFDPASLTRPFGAAGDALAATLGRWDSVWYLAVAHDGYPGAGGPRTAFFPLYPLLVRRGGRRRDAAAGGRRARQHRVLRGRPRPPAPPVRARARAPRRARDRAGGRVLPGLALSLGRVRGEPLPRRSRSPACSRRGRAGGPSAGALGALAAGTRSAGLVLVVPLAVLWWTSRPRRAGDLACVAIVPAGTAAFCGWLALRGGSALGPFEAQAAWYRSFAGPFAGAWDGLVAAWAGARQLLSGSREHVFFARAGGDPMAVARANLVLAVSLVLAVPALVGTFRRLPAAYGAYALAALALPLSWPVAPQPLMSLPRFEAVLFPLFMWLGAWAAEGGAARRRALLALGALGLAGCSALFATWRWVA